MLFYVLAKNEIRIIEESSDKVINPTATVVLVTDATIICAIHNTWLPTDLLSYFPILTTTSSTDAASGNTNYKI